MCKKLILFDVSGVLVELIGGPSTLLSAIENPWKAWFASQAVQRFESGGCCWHQFAAAFIDEMNLDSKPEELYASFASWPKRLFPGAIDLVSSLRRAGYAVATLSNTNPVHWTKVVEQLHLSQYISDHFPSHVTGYLKPHPMAFKKVIDYYGCYAGEIAFFDDNRVNVEGARRLGIDAFETRWIEDVTEKLAYLGVGV